MRRKLHSKNGATLIISLVFFVICAVLGFLVLTAATTASGRAASSGISRIESDQYRFSMESAIRFVRSQIEDQAVFYKKNHTNPTDLTPGIRNVLYDRNSHTYRYTEGGDEKTEDTVWNELNASPQGTASCILNELAIVSKPADWTYSSIIDQAAASGNLKNVKCDFKSDQSYNISVILTILDDEGSVTGESKVIRFPTTLSNYPIETRKVGTDPVSIQKILMIWGEMEMQS